MAYQIRVSTADQLIHLRLIGDMSHQNVYDFNQDMIAALHQNHAHSLHVLIDASDLTDFPGSLHTMRRMPTYLNEPTLGWVIDWGNKNTNFYFINSVLNQMAGAAYASCATLDEAHQRIASTRKTSLPTDAVCL